MVTFKLILALLTISLAFAAPVLAQNIAASEQYTPCSDAPENVACIQSVEGGFKIIAKNATKSAKASGAALTDAGASVEKDSSIAKAAGIERLPDTGGVSPLIPGVGLLLVAAGVLRSKIIR